jgi:hypothetical protein
VRELGLVANSYPLLPTQLFYWHRESRSSTAEVEYVLEQQGTLLPIEVTIGSSDKMKSLYRFIGEGRESAGMRVSEENFSSFESERGKIDILPLVALEQLQY